ncbi:hypothetical protein [Streptomyces sp. NPDC057257]|uniref:hypothetical protein n=1 Tax=Streptomyces sp. NPDC057257 TaxID=3346071 RepID=UPI003640E36F
MVTVPESAGRHVLLAHMYVQSTPDAYVILLVVAVPVALPAWWFWARMMVPKWREKTPPVSRDQPNAVQATCGCHLLAFAMLGLVVWGIRGLVLRL